MFSRRRTRGTSSKIRCKSARISMLLRSSSSTDEMSGAELGRTQQNGQTSAVSLQTLKKTLASSRQTTKREFYMRSLRSTGSSTGSALAFMQSSSGSLQGIRNTRKSSDHDYAEFRSALISRFVIAPYQKPVVPSHLSSSSYVNGLDIFMISVRRVLPGTWPLLPVKGEQWMPLA